MKRALALLLLISQPMVAQIPRAEAVDPTLSPDAGADFFQRGKNLYDAAQASTTQENRMDYFQRAAQIFSEYLNSFPNHPNAEVAWWYLGNCYYLSGQVEDGKRCFSSLMNRYGDGKWAAFAAYTLAADYYNKAEYAFAVPLFERFAANPPKPEERSRGYYYSGNCYRFLKRDREATAAYRKVIADPAGGLYAPQSKVALGHLSLSAGKLQDALAQFEEVVAAPYTPKIRGEAALHASLAATKLGLTEQADKFLQIILNTPGMDDFRGDAQTALMGNLFAKKQYREVVEIFRRSSAKAEGEKEGSRLMLAARSYMRLKQPTEALQLFRDVEKLVKPETDMAFQAAYYRLLCFFQIEGRHLPDQVDAFLQLYRKSRPDDARIHTALMMKAESLFSNKETAAAAAVYSEINAAIISEKNRPGLLYQRGWCLSEAGEAQGAIRSLSDFISKYPDDSRIPSAYAKRAKAYADSSEPAKAIADFDRLTTNDETPADLKSFAWLESARLRRTESNFPDMIVRYQGLLQNDKDLTDNLQAEANYYIGWGMWKNNNAKDSIPYLEKARKLRPDAYRKHAGLILALSYYAAQDSVKLAEEINLAIAGKFEDDIPNQAIEWAGMQSFYTGDYAASAKFLTLVSNPKEPRETANKIWRHLAKARLETNDAEGALTAVDNVLAAEENPALKADSLVDRGRALFVLKRFDESRKTTDEASALGPQGHTAAGLKILDGDLEMNAGDPKTAAARYQVVVLFHVDDKELKPIALWKLVQALEKQADQPEADKYRQQLQTEFPDWKSPKS